MSCNEQRTVNFDGSSSGFCVCVGSLAVLAGQAAGVYVGDGMSKEAMKLALEHAKRDERHMNHAETRYWCRMYRDIAEKAIEALAEQPAQQVVDSYEKAGAYMEARLWEFIDMAAAWPKTSPDPRT